MERLRRVRVAGTAGGCYQRSACAGDAGGQAFAKRLRGVRVVRPVCARAGRLLRQPMRPTALWHASATARAGPTHACMANRQSHSWAVRPSCTDFTPQYPQHTHTRTHTKRLFPALPDACHAAPCVCSPLPRPPPLCAHLAKHLHGRAGCQERQRRHHLVHRGQPVLITTPVPGLLDLLAQQRLRAHDARRVSDLLHSNAPYAPVCTHECGLRTCVRACVCARVHVCVCLRVYFVVRVCARAPHTRHDDRDVCDLLGPCGNTCLQHMHVHMCLCVRTCVRMCVCSSGCISCHSGHTYNLLCFNVLLPFLSFLSYAGSPPEPKRWAAGPIARCTTSQGASRCTSRCSAIDRPAAAAAVPWPGELPAAPRAGAPLAAVRPGMEANWRAGNPGPSKCAAALKDMAFTHRL